MAQHLEIPHAALPDFLEGLQPPVSVDEALDYAEERGASPEVLRFMESLPAAVYTSEEGMRHAFSTLQHGQIPPTDPDAVQVSKDGTST